MGRTVTGSAVVYGQPVVCVTAGTQLGTGLAGRCLTVASAKPEDVACALLFALADQLSVAARALAPIVLVSSRISARQAEAFFAQCRDADRRPRPLASVRMETSLMIQEFSKKSEWSGSAYAIVTPGPDAADSAVRWARAGVASRSIPAAYVCEVLPYGPDQAGVVAAGSIFVPEADSGGIARPPTVPAELVGLRPRPYLLDVLSGIEQSLLSKDA